MGKVAGEQQAVGGSAGSRVAGVGGAAGRAGAQPGGPGALPLLVFEPSPPSLVTVFPVFIEIPL